MTILNRRAAIEQSILTGIGLSLGGVPLQVAAQNNEQGDKPPRALREMSIHKIKELGLEIWIENQPEWEASLIKIGGLPTFSASSPTNYHPPAAMMFQSFPKEKVPAPLFYEMAKQAIRRASGNWGLNANLARAILVTPQNYGVLEGYEGNFVGLYDAVRMDVKMFVGQSPGRYPVVMWIYTLEGKMSHLGEVVRRSWGRLKYL